MIYYLIFFYKQEVYKEWNDFVFFIFERIYVEVVSFFISLVMEMEDIKRVVEVVNEYKMN